jgi:hypothetical protein
VVRHLAALMIARLGSVADAEEAIGYIAPVGEKRDCPHPLGRQAVAVGCCRR